MSLPAVDSDLSRGLVGGARRRGDIGADLGHNHTPSGRDGELYARPHRRLMFFTDYFTSLKWPNSNAPSVYHNPRFT